ncbi:hypothetical protein [Acetobacterium wieringae]|uniref:hypothetical protein n=1 Tax=Acetobacterium wieringae TaxID=52694 RepID=UPI0020336205|nr:hypothetical protein [Acetobacterium wieringae]URN85161.1 hypothetical protein CHL1_000791 [Acetobacterium wieringae]
MAKHKTNIRVESEYKSILNEQIHFLIKSAEEFDKGYFSEAKRLATTIRVLLHDTRTSISLLKQIGIKDSIKYYNTANFLKEEVEYYMGPISVVTIPDPHVLKRTYINTYLPVLDEMKNTESDNWITFDTWWTHKIFIASGISFTRKEFVHYLANQDGGAHIDPQLDEKYCMLTKNSFSFLAKYKGIDKEIPFENLHLAMSRQIAHELLITLKKYIHFQEKYKPEHRGNKKGNICNIEVSHVVVAKLPKTESPFLKRP